MNELTTVAVGGNGDGDVSGVGGTVDCCANIVGGTAEGVDGDHGDEGDVRLVVGVLPTASAAFVRFFLVFFTTAAPT